MVRTAVSTTRTLNVAGIGPVELNVEGRGDGQPFLLLHGGAGPHQSQRWRNCSPRPHPRGHAHPPRLGGTRRPDGLNSVAGLGALYKELVDDLGLEDVTVVGNSVGGWVAAEIGPTASLAAHQSALVLLDAVGLDVEGQPGRRCLRSIRARDPGPLVPRPDALPCRSATHPRRPERPSVARPTAAAFAVYAGSPAMADPTLRGRLGGIAIPALVLWARAIEIVEPPYGAGLRRRPSPGARSEVLPATGHMPQMETPDLVLQTIWEWRDAS